MSKNNSFAPCALQSVFVECYSKEIKTAPKLPLLGLGPRYFFDHYPGH